MKEGHLYPQLSFSSYFRGLSILQSNRASDDVTRAWVPIRVFDPSSLTATDGASILDRLCRQCTYLIVEDQDMRPDDLGAHIERYSLEQLRAIDLTSSMGLKDNYAYLIWNKDQRTPDLEGRRLW